MQGVNSLAQHVGSTPLSVSCLHRTLSPSALKLCHLLRRLSSLAQCRHGNFQRADGLANLTIGIDASAWRRFGPCWWNERAHDAMVVLLTPPPATEHKLDRRRHGNVTRVREFRIGHPA